MLRALLPALACVVLASCGAKSDATHESNGATAVENETFAKLSLTSSAFKDGQPIPTQYSCDGLNQSPALEWGEPPAGTKSFALVIDDPDAPSGTFRHWGAYDIPASASGRRSTTTAVSRATRAPARPRATACIIIISSCSRSTWTG